MEDDFAEVKRAYREFKQESQHQDRELKHAQQQRTVLKSQLEALSSRQTDLDQQEKRLENADTKCVQQIKSIKNSQLQRTAKENELKQRMLKAKAARNQAWLKWLLKKYGRLDQMTLLELQKWADQSMMLIKQSKAESSSSAPVTTAKKEQVSPVLGAQTKKSSDNNDGGNTGSGSSSGSSDDGGSGGKSQYLKVQDEQLREANEQQDTKMKNVGEVARVQKADQPGDERTMNLAKKQRIYINRDENDPIDTLGEAEDAEQLENPLGNRDAEDDANRYLDRQAKAQKKAREKYSKDMDEFEL